LDVVVPLIQAIGRDTVLIGNNLPEFGTNLVTALASLKMDDFTHD